MKETCAAAAAASAAAEDDGKVVLDGNARLQRSINSDVYYVSCSSLSCSAESNDGRRIEFRKCGRTKAKRTVVVIACLTLLDLTISIAVVPSLLVQCTFLAFLCLHLTLSLVFSVYKEEVVVVRGLGVQVSSTSWAGLSSSVFLPHTVVGDLVINEGITMCRVVFYLAVTVVQRKAGTDTPPQILKLYPLFTEFHPRLSTIQECYHLLRDSLYEPSASPRKPSP